MQGGYIKSNTVYISWKADTTAATFSGGNIAYYVGSTTTWTADTDDDFIFRVVEATAGTNYYISGSNIKLESGQLSGIYYTSIKDIGYVCEAKIIIEYLATITQGLLWSSDSTRAFNTSATLRFSGAESPSSVTFDIRTSEDNITWGSWVTWILADYKCRYFQIRMNITRETLSTDLAISSFSIKADLPDVDERGNDTISVAADGKAITFSKTFHVAPSVNIDIVSGTGYVHKFSVVPTITGFTVKVYDMAGVAVTGDFTYHAHSI